MRRRAVAAGWIGGLTMGLSSAWWWGSALLGIYVLAAGVVFTVTAWTATREARPARPPRERKRPTGVRLGPPYQHPRKGPRRNVLVDWSNDYVRWSEVLFTVPTRRRP